MKKTSQLIMDRTARATRALLGVESVRDDIRRAVSCTQEELAEWARGGMTSRLSIADVPLPAETGHCLVSGAVGSGKTTCMTSIMAQVRKAGGRAIVHDRLGLYTARFHRPGKDVILNPFDKRSPPWTLANEIRRDSDREAIAAAMIPDGRFVRWESFWTTAAHSVLVAAMRHLHRHGITDNISLFHHVVRADIDRIHELLGDTRIGERVRRCSKMDTLRAIMSILANPLGTLEYLPDRGESFSIRDWVENGEEDSWLFIASRADFHQAVTPLKSVWMDIANRGVLGLSESRTRRVHEFIDDFSGLQTLPSLPPAMREGRSNGLRVFLAVRSACELWRRYGEHVAREIIGLCGARVAFRASDGMTVGMNHDMLSGFSRDGRNCPRVTPVTPSDLRGLPDLEAHLKVRDDFPAARVKFRLVDREEISPSIVLRATWDVDGNTGDAESPKQQQ